MTGRYLTRDGKLFEIAGEDLRRNAGDRPPAQGPTFIREVALRDVITEEVCFVTGKCIADYVPVELNEPNELEEAA